MAARRRVVVTGIGAITPLGNTFVESWNALLQGHCGITTLEEALKCQEEGGGGGRGASSSSSLLSPLDWNLARQLPSQVAAPVRNVAHDARTARFVQLALLASRDALQHAKLIPTRDDAKKEKESTAENTDKDDDDTAAPLAASSPLYSDPLRTGVSMGCAVPSPREYMDAIRLVDSDPKKGLRKLSPHFVPKALGNSAAGRVSIAFGCQGPNQSAITACAAGSHAIADAYTSIQMNQADVMLAGGTEACIDPLSLAGFCRLRALSTGLPPHQSSRPFDQQRNGFVMGEGSAVLVLEELQHALNRHAPILGELCGYGLSGDAHHITSPHPQGRGAERAMTLALQHAGIADRNLVGYVNSHATSTPKGDEIEASVIHRVFAAASSISNRSHPLRVSSTKGATAHLLGAAGAIEAAFTVQALYDQCIPHTLNLEQPGFSNGDESLSSAFDFVQHQPLHLANQDRLEVAMSNSFGFGGVNACLVFRRWGGE